MCQALFINSPLFRERKDSCSEDSLPPLGLGYILTNLQSHSINSELVDAVAEDISVADILKIIERKRPEFVGLNIFTTNIEIVRNIVDSCNVDTNFIIGGPATKHIYREILEWSTHNPMDIVIGEGDYIASEIINERTQERPVYETTRRRVYKVDSSSKYFPRDISSIPLDRTFFKNEPIRNPAGLNEVNIVTSRGCIHNCAFCGAARSLNQDIMIRERTRQSIISEIECLIHIHPEISSVRILDDLFLKNKSSFAKAIDIFSALKTNWRSMAHISSFRDVPMETIKGLKDCGCSEIFTGIESGSGNILKRIHKTDDLTLIKMCLEKLFSAGINVKAYFIYGFPDETEDDFKATYNFACELKELSLRLNSKLRISVFQYRPYHGTELYSYIKSKLGKVYSIVHDEALSKRIGRYPFNFSGGNYTCCSDELLFEYIAKTNDLNKI